MLDLVQAIAALLGAKAPSSTVPVALVKLVAQFGDFASNFTGKEPAFTPEMAEGLGGNSTVSAAKAQRELGFKVVPLEVMVKDCYDWMRAEGRI